MERPKRVADSTHQATAQMPAMAITPIGTPTNLIAIAWLRENTGSDIGFLQWMAFGLPAAMLLIPVAWFVLTRGLPKHFKSENNSQEGQAQDEIRSHLDALGKVSTPEARVAMVFGLIATLWVLRVPIQDYVSHLPLLGWTANINDMGIAAFGAVLMFLVPAGGKEKRSLLSWEEAENLPWGVLLLFGGGISLGNAVKSTGLSEWLGGMLASIEGAPTIVMILVVVALVVYLTEVTSNVATMTTLAPVLGAFAIGVGAPPEAFLGPAAVAASCAFMLPVATAPNAIVYGSKHVYMKDMIQAGFWINVGAVVVITLIGTYLAPMVL